MELRPGAKADRSRVTFVLHLTVTPANKDGAPLDGKAIHAFLSRWLENVTARGVKIMAEQIKTAPSAVGNGVDLEITSTLW